MATGNYQGTTPNDQGQAPQQNHLKFCFQERYIATDKLITHLAEITIVLTTLQQKRKLNREVSKVLSLAQKWRVNFTQKFIGSVHSREANPFTNVLSHSYIYQH